MDETTRRVDRVIVRRSAEDGQWYVRRKAPNGETLFTSEGYTRKASAVEAAYREAAGDGCDVIVEGE